MFSFLNTNNKDSTVAAPISNANDKKSFSLSSIKMPFFSKRDGSPTGTSPVVTAQPLNQKNVLPNVDNVEFEASDEEGEEGTFVTIPLYDNISNPISVPKIPFSAPKKITNASIGASFDLISRTSSPINKGNPFNDVDLLQEVLPTIISSDVASNPVISIMPSALSIPATVPTANVKPLDISVITTPITDVSPLNNSTINTPAVVSTVIQNTDAELDALLMELEETLEGGVINPSVGTSSVAVTSVTPPPTFPAPVITLNPLPLPSPVVVSVKVDAKQLEKKKEEEAQVTRKEFIQKLEVLMKAPGLGNVLWDAWLQERKSIEHKPSSEIDIAWKEWSKKDGAMTLVGKEFNKKVEEQKQEQRLNIVKKLSQSCAEALWSAWLKEKDLLGKASSSVVEDRWQEWHKGPMVEMARDLTKKAELTQFSNAEDLWQGWLEIRSLVSSRDKNAERALWDQWVNLEKTQEGRKVACLRGTLEGDLRGDLKGRKDLWNLWETQYKQGRIALFKKNKDLSLQSFSKKLDTLAVKIMLKEMPQQDRKNELFRTLQQDGYEPRLDGFWEDWQLQCKEAAILLKRDKAATLAAQKEFKTGTTSPELNLEELIEAGVVDWDGWLLDVRQTIQMENVPKDKVHATRLIALEKTPKLIPEWEETYQKNKWKPEIEIAGVWRSWLTEKSKAAAAEKAKKAQDQEDRKNEILQKFPHDGEKLWAAWEEKYTEIKNEQSSQEITVSWKTWLLDENIAAIRTKAIQKMDLRPKCVSQGFSNFEIQPKDGALNETFLKITSVAFLMLLMAASIYDFRAGMAVVAAVDMNPLFHYGLGMVDRFVTAGHQQAQEESWDLFRKEVYLKDTVKQESDFIEMPGLFLTQSEKDQKESLSKLTNLFHLIQEKASFKEKDLVAFWSKVNACFEKIEAVLRTKGGNEFLPELQQMRNERTLALVGILKSGVLCDAFPRMVSEEVEISKGRDVAKLYHVPSKTSHIRPISGSVFEESSGYTAFFTMLLEAVKNKPIVAAQYIAVINKTEGLDQKYKDVLCQNILAVASGQKTVEEVLSSNNFLLIGVGALKKVLISKILEKNWSEFQKALPFSKGYSQSAFIDEFVTPTFKPAPLAFLQELAEAFSVSFKVHTVSGENKVGTSASELSGFLVTGKDASQCLYMPCRSLTS